MKHQNTAWPTLVVGLPWLTVILAIVMWDPGPAAAEQFTCIDQDYVHNRWYYHEEFPWQPSDWTAPVDYASGTAYFRVEVRSLDTPIDSWETSNTNRDSEPDGTALYFAPQVCLFQDAHIPSKHACFASETITFNEPGIYYGSHSLPQMYQYEAIAWTRELMNPMIIGKTKSPTGYSYRDQSVNMRYSVIIVADNHTFAPPAWWDGLSAVTDLDHHLPNQTAALASYPNPFNPATTLHFELAEAATVSLRIFDLAGHAVRTLIDSRPLLGGNHEIRWRGRDDSGRLAPGGVYLALLEFGAVRQALRLTLLK